MIKYYNDKEYLSIIDEIIKNDEFKKMSKINHHNTTRMNHLIKVSFRSYRIAKYFDLDYKEAAIGGILHDFYSLEIKECDKFKEKFKLFSIGHPSIALENANNNFNLNEKEKNIIVSHMFPISKKLPRYKESWIVTGVDKFFSIGEFLRKLSSKLSYSVGLYIMFLLNIIK